MTKEQKEFFEKGRKYEEMIAEVKADEKYESLIICLLERITGGQNGTVFIPDLDMQLAKRRYVSDMTKSNKEMGLHVRLYKEVN